MSLGGLEEIRQTMDTVTGQTVVSISAIAGNGIDVVINQLFERLKISDSEETAVDPPVW